MVSLFVLCIGSGHGGVLTRSLCCPAHDADYRTAKRDWDTFVESLTERIIDQDSTIPELPAKDLVCPVQTPPVHATKGGCLFHLGIPHPSGY